MRGKFIVFEGIDGSGKSTQVHLLSNKLREEGFNTYTTSEPTDGPIGSTIRNIFKGRIKADQQTIAALFLADRIDHLQNEVNGMLKKIESGITVICDRYYLSSYAYHGVHTSLDWVIELNKVCVETLQPDITFFVDVAPKTSMERLNSGRSEMEIYENLSNLEKVKEKYLEAIDRVSSTENIKNIDGSQDVQEIHQSIWIHTQELLT